MASGGGGGTALRATGAVGNMSPSSLQNRFSKNMMGLLRQHRVRYSSITSHKGGLEVLLIFVTNCDKGWMGCLWSEMSHVKATLYLAHLASNKQAWPLFRTKLSCRLKIIWQSYFGAILVSKKT